MFRLLKNSLKEFKIQKKCYKVNKNWNLNHANINASPNLTIIAEFINYYRNSHKIEFIGDIPYITHIINLIINDVISSLKLNTPKSDEINIYIDNIKKIAKKKKKIA